jgi:hypothetical protein
LHERLTPPKTQRESYSAEAGGLLSMAIIGEEIVPLDWLIRYYRGEIFSLSKAGDEMNQGH